MKTAGRFAPARVQRRMTSRMIRRLVTLFVLTVAVGSMAKLVVSTLAFAAAACLVPQVLLMWMGNQIPERFWADYFRTLRGALQLEHVLDPRRFVRIHRDTLVNVFQHSRFNLSEMLKYKI